MSRAALIRHAWRSVVGRCLSQPCRPSRSLAPSVPGVPPIYVPTESILYRNSIGSIEFQDFGGVVLRHEQVHTQGGGEFQAYMVQRDIFQLFKGDFQPGNFTNLDEQLLGSIDRTRQE